MLDLIRRWTGGRNAQPSSEPAEVPENVTLAYDRATGHVTVKVGTNSMGAGPLSGDNTGVISSSMNGTVVDLRWKGFDTRWFGRPVQIPGAPANPVLAGAQATA